MRKERICFLVAFLGFALFMSAVPASAQTVTGTVSGHVNDKSGASVPSAKVVAKNEQTQAVRETTTNEEGYYLLSFMPIGTYQVTVAFKGFNTVEKKGVVVELNRTTVSDFVLEPASVSATVEVRSGEIPLIDTTSGELKHSLNAQQVSDTPLPGRNFISLVEQVPGFQLATFQGSSNNPTNSTGSYASFSGQGTRSATFQIDGVNNDDSSENQNRQNVNISAIKEFQVLTNSYSSEFGRAGGAVILVQTKSGTNGIHGDLYDFIQNDIFNANDFFANQRGPAPRPPVRRNQYGGTLGGPLWKDHLFFFASGERVSNVGKGSISRFTWLPTDGPRACNPGEAATIKPGGPYCVDPATHPNLQRDLAYMKSIMNLWNTPELQGKTPNDPAACAALITSGRPNRCVLVTGLGFAFPDSDYSGKVDWNTSTNTNMNLRYQYSRQIRQSPRIIFGDNFGRNNNRQYNIGYTVTHVYSNTQTGEFRYGFGNRSTLQDVTDGNDIPTIRFANTLVSPGNSSDTIPFGGTIIGTSTNVPINRHQFDHQFVYNHTRVFTRHTLRMGVDQRFQTLNDIASGTQRGFWTFSTFDSAANVLAGKGFAGWENFLQGIVTGFTIGYGQPFAENHFGETNLYTQDDFRVKRNLTLNLGVRWEGVRAPKEIADRFPYGYKGDFNNVEPRIGFAWTPETHNSLLERMTGGPGNFVIRGGYGVYHGRVFQSIFSQSGLSIRFQPPNGFTFGGPASPCSTNPGGTQPNPSTGGTRNVSGGSLEISDPTCGFVFTPGTASRTVAAACSLTTNGCGGTGQGVKLAGGQLLTTLLLPNSGFHLPYVQQWNFSVERKLPWKVAVHLGYSGNRGIGLPFFSGMNDARFPITSPLVTADVGGGNFQPVVFDRFCQDFSDPICVSLDKNGNLVPGSSGALKSFADFNAPTVTDPNGTVRPANLADKGIVVVNSVPHGYISLNTTRVNERRPDPTNRRNVQLSNFAFTYYNAMLLKVTKVTSHGLTLTASWSWSKTMDTGSEATTTFTDVNAPVSSLDPQRSLRALSSFNQTHRLVLSYAYLLPWMKDQQGALGRIIGGWTISGVATFASGLPFTVLAGYDVNIDGVGGDRPIVTNPSVLFTSVDAGRAQSPCPSALVPPGRCLDTLSQLQLPGTAFIPVQPIPGKPLNGDQFFLTPGQDDPGTIARNAFFEQGQKQFDMALAKAVRVHENIKLELRMELYNAFNRVTFNAPGLGSDTTGRTVNSTIPLGRIVSTVNLQNYVNSARSTGARMGQLAIRITY